MIAQHPHKGLRRVLIVSGVLHLAAVVAIAAFAGTGRAMVTAPAAVEVKLTRLGKTRPKDYLPRKESKPPPPAASTPTPVTKKAPPEATPSAKKKPEVKAKDRLQNLNQLSNALDRLKKYDEPEGSEDGSRFGNTSEVVDATARARFTAELQGCLLENFVLEGIPRNEAAGKFANVEISVTANGDVRYKTMTQGTGNDRLDRQVQNAARRCKKVSKPPPSIGNSWASGVSVKFRTDP